MIEALTRPVPPSVGEGRPPAGTTDSDEPAEVVRMLYREHGAVLLA
jgi:hypothetical protein